MLSVANSGRVAFAFRAKLVGHQSLQGDPLKPAWCERRRKVRFRRLDGVPAWRGRPSVSAPVPGAGGGSEKSRAHVLTAPPPQLGG